MMLVNLFAILRLEGICPQSEHFCGAGIAGEHHDWRSIATCTSAKLQAKLTADDGFRNSFFGNSASILEEQVWCKGKPDNAFGSGQLRSMSTA